MAPLRQSAAPCRAGIGIRTGEVQQRTCTTLSESNIIALTSVLSTDKYKEQGQATVTDKRLEGPRLQRVSLLLIQLAPNHNVFAVFDDAVDVWVAGDFGAVFVFENRVLCLVEEHLRLFLFAEPAVVLAE